MAWFVNTRISVEDHPLAHWSSESVELIKKSNAETISQYAKLSPNDPRFIGLGYPPSGLPRKLPLETWTLVVKDMGSSLPDVITETVVNRKVRDLIEDIEPTVHQYLPVLVKLPDDSVVDDYFHIQVCHRVDAIDFEKSKGLYVHKPQPDQYPDWFYYRNTDPNDLELVVCKETIAGKAIWFDAKFGRTFLSEELGQRFIDEGIRGLCLPKDELGRPMHVKEV